MKTLEQILDEIEAHGVVTKEEVLSSGATHLAQDENGDVFSYSEKPRHLHGLPVWGLFGVQITWCGELAKPENWKECIWELPQIGEMRLS